MEAPPHRILDVLSHLWPYVSGIALTLLATVRLWWYDRKETKRRIGTLEVMAEHMVTKDDLQACRDDVRATDDKNLEKLYQEIKTNTAQNAQQHQDIMAQMMRLHKWDT